MSVRNLCNCALVMPCQVPLVSSIVKAWQATAKGRRGLFDRSFDPEAFRNSTDALYNFGPLVDSISAHQMWLTYLDEIWKARLTMHFPFKQRSGTGCGLLALSPCALGNLMFHEHLQTVQMPSPPGAFMIL